MKNYSNAKIYKIIGNDKVYIGSTTQNYLSSRLAQHKAAYKSYLAGGHNYVSSFDVISDPNCSIELLECVNATCCDEVGAREGHYIRENECCNKNIAGRNIKTYYIDNADRIKQKYQAEKEQKRQYYLDNREKRIAYQKERYQKLKQIILDKE